MVTSQQNHGGVEQAKHCRSGNQRPEVNPFFDTISSVTLGKLLLLSVPHFFICIVVIIILILTPQGSCADPGR